MMKILNADAMRRAMDETRAGNLLKATAMIQQTLGQPGSIPQSSTAVRTNAKRKSSIATKPPRKRYTCTAGSREYIVHLPRTAPKGVLMMLHGCTQTPEDFATGTDIAKAADRRGMLVILPAQDRGDNAQSCWNWFSGADQQRGRGEPAILAGLATEIAREYSLSSNQTFVAGLSAGGAMAVILGETYDDVFAGVAVHSGLPFGSARGVNEAFAAMRGDVARTRPSTRSTPTPTIVFHGSADHTVVPSNGEQIIADVLNKSGGQQTQIVTEGVAGDKAYTQTTTLGSNGAPLTEHWHIEDLGHAWSGGNPSGSHTDLKGPDASTEMLRFFQSLSDDEV